MKTIKIKNNLTNFFRFNLISLRLSPQYKLNIYMILLLFICILSSLIIRSNLINEYLINKENELMLLIYLVIFFTILYTLYLIFYIIKRCIEAYKIIPEFIIWHKLDVKNIKSIISYYYIQKIFFISLSIYILYNVFNSLNLYINSIHIYIITIGILSSIIFIKCYPLNKFKIYSVKEHSLIFYLLLFIFFILYIYIIPKLIYDLINNEKFINLYLNKCLEHLNNYMFPFNNNNKNLLTNTPSSSRNTENILNQTLDNSEEENILENIQINQGNNSNIQTESDNSSKKINNQKNVLSNVNKQTTPRFNISSRINLVSMFDNINKQDFKQLKKETFNTVEIFNEYIPFKPNRFNINHFYSMQTGNQNISRESIETFKLVTNINYLLPELSLKKQYGNLFNIIENNLSTLSFWDNYNYLSDLHFEYDELTYEHYNYFISKLINESANQDQINEKILCQINNLNLIHNNITDEFIYLNNFYSIRTFNNINRIYVIYNYKAYYWDDLLFQIQNEINKLNEFSLDYSLQEGIYNDLKNYNEIDYYGIKKFNETHTDIVPLLRERIFSFKINFDMFPGYSQNNNTFYYWNNYECFTFKFRDKLTYIPCNNKYKLFQFINNEKLLFIEELNKFIIKNNLNFIIGNITNENLYYKANEILNYVYLINVEDIENINFINELEYKSTKLRIMEKVVKSNNIPNLDNNLKQNQNVYKFCNKIIKKL
jgi:hypothetical protein